MDYFISNAWTGLRVLSAHGDVTHYTWDETYCEKEILHIRKAWLSPGLYELPAVYCYGILTNMASVLNHIGRSVEAIEYWDLVIEMNPKFGMARGNRARALVDYARLVENRNVGAYILKCAYPELKYSIECEDPNCMPEGRQLWLKNLKHIERLLTSEYLQREINVDQESLGATEIEITYRNWCLHNRLMLNPLNDLGSISIAGKDNLTISHFTASLKIGHGMIGLFNQLKQEFVSARFMFFDGLHLGPDNHFSDREVTLPKTCDSPEYSYSLEKMKLAFRTFYSLFDKIAYWLSIYFELVELDASPHKISFKSIWYNNQKKNDGLRREFSSTKNWPLRGLFWLSKDLFENGNDFDYSIDPVAKDLSKIRNYLEHRFLGIHRNKIQEEDFIFGDNWSFHIELEDFQKKTLKLAKLARSAIMYLGMTLQNHEHERKQKKIVTLG